MALQQEMKQAIALFNLMEGGIDNKNITTPFRLQLVTTNSFLQAAFEDSFRRMMKRKKIGCQRVTLDTFILQNREGQRDFFYTITSWIVALEQFAIKGSSKKKEKQVEKEEPLKVLQNALNSNKEDYFLILSSKPVLENRDRAEWQQFSYFEEKPWLVRGAAVAWCQWYVREKAEDISLDVFEAIYDDQEGDFLGVQSEIDKLLLYAQNQKKITMKTLVEISEQKGRASLFELLEQLLTGSYQGITYELKKIDEEGTIFPVQIIRFVIQQLRSLLKAVFLGKAPKYMSRAVERRMEWIQSLGIYRVESWLQRLSLYEIQLRNGEVPEDLSSFLPALVPFNSR